MLALARLGYGLEVLGLFIAVWGYWRTWKDLKTKTDEQFFARILAVIRRLRSIVRRLLRRPQVITVKGSVTLPAMVASGHGYVSPPRLPDPGQGIGAFAAAVQAALDNAVEQAHRGNVRLSRRLDAVESDSVERERRLSHRIDETEKDATSQRVRGLREQVAGWAFIVIGLGMQGPVTLWG